MSDLSKVESVLERRQEAERVAGEEKSARDEAASRNLAAIEQRLREYQADLKGRVPITLSRDSVVSHPVV
jgi:hypothetical protein